MNSSAIAVLTVAAVALFSGCSKQSASATSPTPASSATEAKRHPLKGVVVDVVTAESALLVKHQEIPGYMMAMTMQFKVDAATLKAAQKGQSITATLVERDDGYWLEDVKPSAEKP